MGTGEKSKNMGKTFADFFRCIGKYKTAHLDKIQGNVSFSHVRFGQKIAIVGPTGAGKTTIVNLLMRFYEVNDGSIAIDGVPTMDLRRGNIHDLFGMVLQDTWMFEGTVRENLVYSKENVTDADLDRVCKAVGLTTLIRQLPNGYDTVLSDNTNLSAGQKQLFTIAHAMDLLTLGRTSFVIAHRLSTIKNADCILAMKDGDIIESGSHDELMARNGFYADLYNSQFEQAS